jgi:hypothetical protein
MSKYVPEGVSPLPWSNEAEFVMDSNRDHIGSMSGRHTNLDEDEANAALASLAATHFGPLCAALERAVCDPGMTYKQLDSARALLAKVAAEVKAMEGKT